MHVFLLADKWEINAKQLELDEELGSGQFGVRALYTNSGTYTPTPTHTNLFIDQVIELDN